MKNKNILFWTILFVLLIGITVPLIVNISRTIEDVNEQINSKNNVSDTGQNSSGGYTDPDGDAGIDDPVQDNNDPSHETKPVSFMMRSDPEFAFSNDPSNSYTGIRFIADVPYTLVKSVEDDSDVNAYTMIAPLDYFEQVYDSSVDVMDWVIAFQNAGLSFIKMDVSVKYEYSNGTVNSVFSSVIKDIKYKNTNRKFTAISFIEKDIGEADPVRIYATFDEGQSFRSTARSFAYVAVDKYNRSSALGACNENYDELLAVSEVTNNSVDLTNGQASETENDGSCYLLTNFSVSASVSIDQTIALKWTVNPSAEVPILWYSENAAVATVENGLVKGVNSGSTQVCAVLCGIVYRCNVTVT